MNSAQELSRAVKIIEDQFPAEQKIRQGSTSDIGNTRIEEIVLSRPLDAERAYEILAKYNSITRDMNKALREKMAGHGFEVSFGDRGAYMVGRKGKTIKFTDQVRIYRKRQWHEGWD